MDKVASINRERGISEASKRKIVCGVAHYNRRAKLTTPLMSDKAAMERLVSGLVERQQKYEAYAIAMLTARSTQNINA
jgi:hypothetical protein